MRAPDACFRQAEQVGPAVGQFVTVLLSGTFPWARLRQAQKLLRLAERYGAARVNAACARALGFDLVDVRASSGSSRPPWNTSRPRARGAVVPLPARFARAPRSFAHHPHDEEESPMDIAPDLVRRLKRLRLGSLVPTLPDRATQARQAKLSPLEFLELLLQDEIDRRESQGLPAARRRRLRGARHPEAHLVGHPGELRPGPRARALRPALARPRRT